MKDECGPKEDETVDSLTCGNLFIYQKKNGYRYSLDSYLLAAFVDEEPGTEAVDIGSGSGILSILLASVKGLKMTGIEIQQGLAEMSMRSVNAAGLSERVSIICCDIKDYTCPEVEAVVANPPFRPLKTGRINPGNEKAIARHELSINLDTLLDRAYDLLKDGGRFYIVYPSWRIPDLMECLRTHRLEPKRLRFVHTYIDSSSEICLVNAVKNGGKECVVERPIIVYSKEKTYHHEMELIFRDVRLEKNH